MAVYNVSIIESIIEFFISFVYAVGGGAWRWREALSTLGKDSLR